eukprot:3790142-Amphidinium_carterae.1
MPQCVACKFSDSARSLLVRHPLSIWGRASDATLLPFAPLFWKWGKGNQNYARERPAKLRRQMVKNDDILEGTRESCSVVASPLFGVVWNYIDLTRLHGTSRRSRLERRG